MKKLFLSLIACLLGIAANAQISSKGTEFFFAFPQIDLNPDSMVVFVTSDVNTTFTIDNPRVVGTARTFNVVANQVTRVTMSVGNHYVTGSETTQNLGTRIRANAPVYVYMLNLKLYRTGGTFILPTSAIPYNTEYIIPSYTPTHRTNMSGTATYSQGQMTIIAIDDNTPIEIIPRVRTANNRTAGTPFNITLNRGQVYQVQTHINDGSTANPPTANGDLSGSIVRVRNSCKRINVISGAESVTIPGANCLGRDHLIAQIFPTNVSGKNYYISPFVGSSRGYLFRVFPVQDTTTIFVNGTSVGTFNRTQWFQENVTTAASRCITANKPVMVVQYMKGQQCSGLNDADPAMINIPAVDQTVRKAVVGTANTANLTNHFVNIIVDVKFRNRVKLNGNPVPLSSFVTGCNNIAYAQIRLGTNGAHVVECDSGFQVLTYGYGNFESYAYYSGANFEDLRYDLQVIQPNRCPSYPVTFKGSGSNALGFTWRFGDGTSDTGSTVTHRFEEPGSYLVRMVIKIPGVCGTFDSVVRTRFVDVYPGPAPKFPDSLLVCDDSLRVVLDGGASNKFLYKWQDSSSNRTFTVRDPGKYWIRVTDTSTNCTVFDSTRIVFADKVIARYGMDSMLPCNGFNYFALKDSSRVTNDNITRHTWTVKYAKDSVFTTPKIRISFDTTGTYTFKYAIRTAKGCTDTTSGTLNIYERPVALFTVDTNRRCQGAPFNFTDQSTTVSGTLHQFIWIWGDGSANGSGNRPSKSYNRHDTFNVREIVVTNYGCRDTIDSAVVVLPTPRMAFTRSDTALCQRGNSFTFTSTSSIPLGSFTYDWRFPDVSYFNTDIIVKEFPTPGIYPITLKGLSDQGCADSFRSQIRIKPHPTARMNLSPSSQCINGGTFRLRDSSTISGGVLRTRTWNLGDGNTDTNALIPAKRYSAAGTYTVRLISISTENCRDTITRDLTVHPKPNATFNVNTANQCLAGNNYSFTSPGGSPYIFKRWTYGDGSASDTGMNKTYRYGDTGTYTVTSIGRNSFGCLDTVTRTVTVKPAPVANFSSSPDSACIGTTFSFTNSSFFNGGTINSYQWQFGDGGSSNQANSSRRYVAYGRYPVRLIAIGQNGCNDTIFKNVRVYPKPVAAYAINDSDQCFTGHNFAITNTSTIAEGVIATNEWDLAEGVTSSLVNPANRQFGDIGSYQTRLIVSSAFGCMDTAWNGLHVFPSPTVSFRGDSACQGEEFFFTSTATVNPGTIQSYQWDFGDGGSSNQQNPVHRYMASGGYTVSLRVLTDQGCETVVTTPGAALSLVRPRAGFISNHLGSRGFESDYIFTDRSTGGDQWFWYLGDGRTSTDQNPRITYTDTGRMRVVQYVTNAAGCSDSTFEMLWLKPELMWWVPTAFTPNRDTKNETWGPEALYGTLSYHMQLFNRWGELVWDNKNPNVGWDGTFKGKPVPEGVYVWTVWLRYLDGRFYSFRGTVTVLR
jgi:gliding motility-associated-like protein